MPVPNTMGDLSTTAGSNYPTGSEVIGNNLDNYLRAHASLIRQPFALGSSVAAASTTDVAPASGESVEITGAATINSLGAGFVGCRRELRFSGVCVLTHSGSLQLPGAGDITTAAGSVFTFRCISSGVWVLVGGKTVPPGALSGYLPTWAAIDPAAKQNALGYTPVNAAGDTMTGVLIARPAIGGAAVSIRTPDGSKSFSFGNQYAVANDGVGWIANEANADIVFATDNTARGRILSGGALSWSYGINTGSAVAAGASDLSKHIALYGSIYGFSTTTNRLNYVVASAGAHKFVVDGSDVAGIDASGITSTGSISDGIANLRDIPPIANAGNSNLSQAHRGQCHAKTNNSAYTITVQPNASVAIAVGTAVTFSNAGGTTGNLVVARGSGVAIYRNGTNADVTLTPGNSVTLLKIATDIWQA